MSSGQRGMDRVRNAVIGKMDFKLKYFEECFTSEHWMVRIYRVRPLPLRDARLPNPRRKGGDRKGSRRRRAVSD